MSVINEGVDCQSCARQGMLNYCRPCSKKPGRQMWEPADGVQVEIIDSWGTHPNQLYPDKIRRIKEKAAI